RRRGQETRAERVRRPAPHGGGVRRPAPSAVSKRNWSILGQAPLACVANLRGGRAPTLRRMLAHRRPWDWYGRRTSSPTERAARRRLRVSPTLTSREASD